jgi:molybdopterin converting factor small subunit
MKNTILIILLIAVSAYQAFEDRNSTDSDAPISNDSNKSSNSTNSFNNSNKSSVQKAFKNRLSDYQVEDTGIVVKVLADDLHGSRHQKFLLKNNNITLLFAHNIDLAPRIKNLQEGDRVDFFGEYEWNPKGGVVHWTHHDPRGNHASGWLKHKGKKYD